MRAFDLVRTFQIDVLWDPKVLHRYGGGGRTLLSPHPVSPDFLLDHNSHSLLYPQSLCGDLIWVCGLKQVNDGKIFYFQPRISSSFQPHTTYCLFNFFTGGIWALLNPTYPNRNPFFFLFFFCLSVFLGLHPQHMEVPRLGVQLEL